MCGHNAGLMANAPLAKARVGRVGPHDRLNISGLLFIGIIAARCGIPEQEQRPLLNIGSVDGSEGL